MTHLAEITGRLSTTGLARAVAIELGVDERDAYAAVQSVFGVIARAVATGHDVNIGQFGSFVARTQRERVARNPQTGESVAVPAHRVVRFRRSARLAELVAAEDPQATVRKRPQGAATPTAPAADGPKSGGVQR